MVKIYEKNMDGLNSFYTTEDGLEHLVKSDSVALIFDSPIDWDKYPCKVGARMET